MNAYHTYGRQPDAPQTRIDLLLALYDSAIGRLRDATAALAENRADDVGLHIGKAQLVLSEIVAGIRPEANPELAGNLYYLFEYVTHQLATPTADSLASAVKILSEIKEGFEAIRTEAIELERGGQVPPVRAAESLAVTA